jgi:hypothetical protein
MPPAWLRPFRPWHHGGISTWEKEIIQSSWGKIWVWINTYENTIFWGMNIHKSQLFWCELQGYYWFWHTAIWWLKNWIGGS